MDKAARTEWLNGLKELDTVFLRLNGHELFILNRHELDLTVEKVEIQYIHLSDGRKVERATGVHRSDNSSESVGVIYPSRESREAEVKRLRDWHLLARDIRNIDRRPDHLTDEDLQTIRALLFPQQLSESISQETSTFSQPIW